MVLINLTKLVKFIDIVNKTPKDVSQRRTRLVKAYDGLAADADFTVSITLSTDAAIRLKEIILDDESGERRVAILDELINNLTDRTVFIPDSVMSKVYLIPSITKCINPTCREQLLVMCRPTRTAHIVSVFTVSCVLEGEVYAFCKM